MTEIDSYVFHFIGIPKKCKILILLCILLLKMYYIDIHYIMDAVKFEKWYIYIYVNIYIYIYTSLSSHILQLMVPWMKFSVVYA